MRITQLEPGVLCVELEGEFDLHSAYDFDRRMRAAEDDAVTVVVVDLRAVTFIDSAGFARILAASQRAERAGRRFAVVRGCKAVERLFAITALDRRLEMVREPEAVLAAAR